MSQSHFTDIPLLEVSNHSVRHHCQRNSKFNFSRRVYPPPSRRLTFHIPDRISFATQSNYISMYAAGPLFLGRLTFERKHGGIPGNVGVLYPLNPVSPRTSIAPFAYHAQFPIGSAGPSRPERTDIPSRPPHCEFFESIGNGLRTLSPSINMQVQLTH